MLLAVYFIYFVADMLRVRFAPDDMMNMAIYWRLTPSKIAASLFMPWRGFYRPLAALYYLPLHCVYGLNPRPYHLVLLLILCAGIGLTYRLGVLLGLEKLTAAFAVLLVAFHAGIGNLYYNTAFIYDALCGLFYLAALISYIRVRQRDQLLTRGQILGFLALYLLALDSKEMAVTLPIVLLAYEWIYHRAKWSRGICLPITLAGLLDAACCYGRAFGANALMKQEAYAPALSLTRWESFQTRSFGELFLAWGQFDMRAVAIVWFGAFYVARRLNRPALWFCWWFAAITPLPIEFLEGRGGACLYIPLIGWAIFAAVIFRELSNRLARFLAGDPALRRFGEQPIAAVLIVASMFLWTAQSRRWKDLLRPSMAALGQPTWDVICQFNALRPVIRPHSNVVFLNDPFDGWDMAFIAELWLGDRSLDIRLDRKTPFSQEELARADYVFTFNEGRLVQLR